MAKQYKDDLVFVSLLKKKILALVWKFLLIIFKVQNMYKKNMSIKFYRFDFINLFLHCLRSIAPI